MQKRENGSRRISLCYSRMMRHIHNYPYLIFFKTLSVLCHFFFFLQCQCKRANAQGSALVYSFYHITRFFLLHCRLSSSLSLFYLFLALFFFFLHFLLFKQHQLELTNVVNLYVRINKPNRIFFL